jgi:quinol monooxygenase YgiN
LDRQEISAYQGRSVMSQTFGLVVRFTVEEGQEAAFDQLTAEILDQVRTHEPSTLVYACHRVEDDPHARVFYELYADRAAFRHHEAQPHTARFLAAREPLLTGTEVAFLRLDAAKGLPVDVRG